MQKEQIEIIEKIGFDRVAKLLRFGNAELLDNIFVIDYIKYIINKCRIITTDDNEDDYIYKLFVLCGNVADTVKMLRFNNLGYKERKPNGKFRFDYDNVWYTISHHDYHDIEINLFAYILFYKNDADQEYINEQIQRIKEMYSDT